MTILSELVSGSRVGGRLKEGMFADAWDVRRQHEDHVFTVRSSAVWCSPRPLGGRPAPSSCRTHHHHHIIISMKLHHSRKPSSLLPPPSPSLPLSLLPTSPTPPPLKPCGGRQRGLRTEKVSDVTPCVVVSDRELWGCDTPGLCCAALHTGCCKRRSDLHFLCRSRVDCK